MCLKVKKTAKRHTAKKDIVVYKRVITDKEDLNLKGVNHGDKCEAVINGVTIKGVITIEDCKYFICSNNAGLDGRDCYDKQGFKYSWIMDCNVESVTVNDITYSQKDCYKTPYRDFVIEIGETYTSELESPDRWNEINIGIHSFKRLKVAKNDGHGLYVKCIIPKDSEYYVGTFDGSTSYASNKLKYVKLVE